MSKLVSSQVLAMIRNTAVDTLTETCTVKRETSSIGAYGEPVVTWYEVAVDAPCRIILSSTRAVYQAGEAGSQETLRHLYKLIVGRGVALDVDYRVTSGGVDYDVIQVETVLTDEAFHSANMVRRS